MRIFICCIFIFCTLSSCGNKQQQSDIEENTEYTLFNQNQDSTTIDSDPNVDSIAEDTDSICYSDLRPKLKLRKNIIYTDTVEFISYEPIGDYSRITVSKNNKECYLLIDTEDDTLTTGDSLIIKWQVVTNCSLDDADDKWLDIKLIQQTPKE